MEADWEKVLWTDEPRFCPYIKWTIRTRMKLYEHHFIWSRRCGVERHIDNCMHWLDNLKRTCLKWLLINKTTRKKKRKNWKLQSEFSWTTCCPICSLHLQNVLLMLDNTRPQGAPVLRNYLLIVGMELWTNQHAREVKFSVSLNTFGTCLEHN